MGKIFETIDAKLRSFIEAQKMYFVATAPLSGEGHVNLSPKGLDSFRILGPNTVAYLDLTGSGAETIAHLKENGRICIMFCAFQGPGRILRLYGKGSVTEKGSPDFEADAAPFEKLPGARSIITIEVTRIADSCGWGVPFYEFTGDRDQYTRFAENTSEDKMAEIQKTGNALSIDGLPAFGKV